MVYDLVVPVVIEPTDSEVFSRALSLVDQSSRVPAITDPEVAGRASDLAKFLKVASTKIDELRDSRVRPLNQQVKEVNAAFRPLAEAVESARQTTLAKLTAWKIAEDRRIREEAEAVRLVAMRLKQEAEAEAMRLAEEGEKSGDVHAATSALDAAIGIAEVAVPIVPAKIAVVSRGNYGSTTGLRDNWTAHVIDFLKLPDTFKLVNESALRSLKSARPDIPGVEWLNNPTAITR